MFRRIQKALMKKNEKEDAQSTAVLENSNLTPPDIFTNEIRALYSQNSYTVTEESIHDFVRSKLFDKLIKNLEKNQLALLSLLQQALLVHLTYITKANNVLEIGTYKAGITFDIASALCEAQSGTITTIDPFVEIYGTKKIIENFPAHIKARLDQRPVSSADYFNFATFSDIEFDIVFIDGNHNFEFAYFDAVCSANLIRPGGVMIFDNIDQAGPRFAAKQFMREHPNWKDLLGGVNAPIPSGESPLSFYTASKNKFITINGQDLSSDSTFYIIQAPKHHVISTQPLTIGPKGFDPRLNIPKANLHVKPTNETRGKLYILAYLRVFHAGQFPIEVKQNHTIDIDSYKQTDYVLPLEDNEITADVLKGSESFTIEVTFLFEAAANENPSLLLSDKPSITLQQL